MPGSSGWDALREAIAALPPIIALNADTHTDSMRDVAGYLSKPINAHELLAILRQHADHTRH